VKLGEFQLIDRFASRLKLPKNSVLLGPGDDCAAVRIGEETLLLTTDMLIEDIHFRCEWTSPEQIGFKAMRVNLSDIAGVGGVPRFALVSLGLPKSWRGTKAVRLFAGLRRAAEAEGVAVVGGDTNASERLVVNVALVGEAGPKILTRAGSKPGDLVYVTGTLGGSALGLKALEKKRTAGFDNFLKSHREPPARVAVGKALARMAGVHAVMDLSDGLAGDLPHLLKAGRVGADITVDAVPRPAGFERAARRLDADPYALIVSGGEDYELVFTASPRVKIPRKIAGVPVTSLGRITPKPGVLRWLRRDGALFEGKGADFRGFRHF
jgi:thiamine-monophosphate kinase